MNVGPSRGAPQLAGLSPQGPLARDQLPEHDAEAVDVHLLRAAGAQQQLWRRPCRQGSGFLSPKLGAVNGRTMAAQISIAALALPLPGWQSANAQNLRRAANQPCDLPNMARGLAK